METCNDNKIEHGQEISNNVVLMLRLKIEIGNYFLYLIKLQHG